MAKCKALAVQGLITYSVNFQYSSFITIALSQYNILQMAYNVEYVVVIWTETVTYLVASDIYSSIRKLLGILA